MQSIKKRDLEIYLQQVPDFSHPKSGYEQYQTPAVIAADVLFMAVQQGDIIDKTIVDLGCGTGIFAIGAAFLHAKKVFAIDIDEVSLQQAKNVVKQQNLSISFKHQDVSSLTLQEVDTVLMNPPFGAQKANRHADRVFLEKAITIANVIYSLHLTHTLPFIYKLLAALPAEITQEKTYTFPLKARLPFHKKLVEEVSVSLLRIVHTVDQGK